MHVYNDGSVHMNHGGTEMGQGLHLKVAQVVAEEFQIDLDRVKITATTTAKVPNTAPTAASSGADLNGMAAQDAARQIRSAFFILQPSNIRCRKIKSCFSRTVFGWAIRRSASTIW